MAARVYSRDELLSEHDYASTQAIAGRAMHGGFDADGTYVSPRSLRRWPAIRAWAEGLKERDIPMLDAGPQLLSRRHYPTRDQQKFLLKNGLGQVFWNSLTVTGVFEGRGKALCQFDLPDFQEIIVEDISDMAVGHMHKGLLYAHGADEGGDPANEEVGAHDEMWFALRDLVFGPNAYPDPEIPETLSRPDADEPLFPQIKEPHSGVLNLLLNLLMIELRAESFFAHCCELFEDEELFTDRRTEALEARDVVERIRTDEALHTVSLQIILSELRSLTFKTVDDGTIKGSDLIDGPWETVVNWHANLLQEGTRERDKARFEAMLLDQPDGDAMLRAFNALEEAG